VDKKPPIEKLREKIEDNLALSLLAALVVGFSTGWGSYKAVLAAANEEPVIKGTYVLKSDVPTYSDYEILKRKYAELRADYDKVRQQYQTGDIKAALGQWAILYEHSTRNIDEPEFYDDKSIFDTLPIMKDWRELLNDGIENAFAFNGHSLAGC
jgi:hypothetical protein